MNNIGAIIEGLLFVAGDDGLTLDQLVDIVGEDVDIVKDALMDLKKDYESDSRGIRIHFLGNTFKLTTKPEHKEYYKKMITDGESSTLSQAALEIDEIRGIASSHLIRKLVAKNFIKEVGRSEKPGRPILYSTTREFLDYFGLSSITDLPKIDEFKDIVDVNGNADEVDLYQSKYKDTDVI